MKFCPPSCTDAPFPHLEVKTNGRFDKWGRQTVAPIIMVICAECRHWVERPRGNCECSELCHIGDQDEIRS